MSTQNHIDDDSLYLQANQLFKQLLDLAGAHSNKDQLEAIFSSAFKLAKNNTSRLDLKITNAALSEMAQAFETFAPYRFTPKVTIFGSARIQPSDPLYLQTMNLAQLLAKKGWMVVTGAGPGVMAAATEGAGREKSFGVNIRLPFEQGANSFIATDSKLVEMKYFFTRKLMLLKESSGFVVLPGGFGTLDEVFELLTLQQTGKAEPAPIVLLDSIGGTYWQGWSKFLKEQVASKNLISAQDHNLYSITDDVKKASDELLNFYSNYHSRRFVGNLLILRMKNRPTQACLDEINRKFSDISNGEIKIIPPHKVEIDDKDALDLARLGIKFDRIHHGKLRLLIDFINTCETEKSFPKN